MGLRINNNISALEALRNLHRTDSMQRGSLERLSTGLRINRASDDPSGLVISEQLRTQIGSIKQSIKNAQNDVNLINTSEAALNEVNSLLVGIRESIVFAMNTGASTPEQIAAEQRSVDRAIGAIDRIAVTTRFASRNLLNGDSDFQVRSRHALIDDLKVRSVRFANNQSSILFKLKVHDLASRATLKLVSGGGPATTGAKSQSGRVSSNTVIVSNTTSGVLSSGQVASLRITGSLGSEDIALASGATIRDLVTAVNAATSSTGVFASSAPVNLPGGVATDATGFSFALYSVGFGSDQTISVENITASGSNVGIVGIFESTSGTYNTGLVQQGFYTADTGDDVDARIDGAVVVADGYEVHVTSNFLDADIVLSERLYQIASNSATNSISGSLAGSGIQFRVLHNSNSGLTFQINSESTSIDRVSVAISSLRSSELGRVVERENPLDTAGSNGILMQGGFLSDIRSGAGSDLTENAANALFIVDEALDQVNDMRSFLGSVQKNTLDTAIASLSIAAQNLSASESSIRDLDFAAETTDFTKAQIMFQAGTSVLASANLIPQAVLSLLQ
ncbi:MAG: flagellin [Planctomycetes bacterium]|nr:flagellin [Planctomycetota bacterium]